MLSKSESKTPIDFSSSQDFTLYDVYVAFLGVLG